MRNWSLESRVQSPESRVQSQESGVRRAHVLPQPWSTPTKRQHGATTERPRKSRLISPSAFISHGLPFSTLEALAAARNWVVGRLHSTT
jgi:hypothetical protein